VTTAPDDETPADNLYLASQFHARRAQELLDSKDRFERMDAAYHAGAAVELMAKALVSQFDHRVLRDQDGGKHAFLEAVASHRRRALAAGPKKPGNQSISARTAVGLAERLAPECADHRGKAERALAARNGAAHMAVVDEASLADVVAGMAAYVSAGATSLRKEPSDFWGRVEWRRVMGTIAESRRQVAEMTIQKVSASKGRYERLVEGLEPEKVSELISMLTGRPQPPADDAWQVDCPACGHDAWLLWSADYEAVRGPDGWEYDGGMALDALQCPVCGLELEGDEVREADVDTSDYREPDWEYDDM